MVRFNKREKLVLKRMEEITESYWMKPQEMRTPISS
jgi:hypothetical protein